MGERVFVSIMVRKGIIEMIFAQSSESGEEMSTSLKEDWGRGFYMKEAASAKALKEEHS